MNILLNFYPVRSGGGQQVATNLLKIINNNSFGHNWFVFAGTGSELDKLAKSFLPNDHILSLEYSYSYRLLKNKTIKRYLQKNSINLIYSYGPILNLSEESIPQVLRSVYSNLYFPEIRFWKGYSKLIVIKKKTIDYLRLKQTLKADGLIFENNSMLERAVSLFKFPISRVQYIAPSVSLFDESNIENKYIYLDNIKEFKILYLSSWHLNKNIHILPYVAKILSDKKIKLKFIFSLDRNSLAIQETLIEVIKKLKVKSYFEFIGKVDALYVHQVVKYSDALILLSKLECFSSNVMEAYKFDKPLIISNEEWAKAACADAALYVERDNAEEISNQINKLIDNVQLRNELISNSRNRMKSFNQPEEKVRKQVEFLEKIYNKYESGN